MNWKDMTCPNCGSPDIGRVPAIGIEEGVIQCQNCGWNDEDGDDKINESAVAETKQAIADGEFEDEQARADAFAEYRQQEGPEASDES